jgi:hypothetical protein
MSIFDGGAGADFGAAMGAKLNGDMGAIRDYVMAHDGIKFANQAEGEVMVTVTHSHLKTQFLDMRLNVHMTIAAVKAKLYTHSGTAQDYQRLLLKSNGAVICEMGDLNRKLGFYSVANGMEIHIQVRFIHTFHPFCSVLFFTILIPLKRDFRNVVPRYPLATCNASLLSCRATSSRIKTPTRWLARGGWTTSISSKSTKYRKTITTSARTRCEKEWL